MGHRGSFCDLCQSVLPRFSSKSFIVSGLTFRSHLVLLCFTDTVVFFFFLLQIEVFWQPCNKQVYWYNIYCSVSMSHFDNSLNISNVSVVIKFVIGSVISDLRLQLAEGSDDG